VTQARRGNLENVGELLKRQIVVTHRGKPLTPKTAGQLRYVEAMAQHDLTFCTGPAGTGKTYLAMAMAVAALRDETVSRIVLTRPIVEAGEALGFLPGDMMDKVDPYLRPLHDALHDIMGLQKFQRHLARGSIEVIPLAYMRGRTLNDSFIVLDEAQNTTPSQMKMALTRLGFGSTMVVTGDVTQTDLPPGQSVGLTHALGILQHIEGIAVCRLTGDDIVRHGLVQRIVSAYDMHASEAGQVNE
jgi:phosphate starvation-inducible PhoH-like protein